MTLQEKSLAAANIFIQTKMRLSEKAASLTCGQTPAGRRMRICRFALKILQTTISTAPSVRERVNLAFGAALQVWPVSLAASAALQLPFRTGHSTPKPSKSHLGLYDHLYAIPALAGPARCITSVRLNPTSLHHLSKSAPV